MNRLARAAAWIDANVFEVVFIAVVSFTLGTVIAHCFFGVAWPLLAEPGRGPR